MKIILLSMNFAPELTGIGKYSGEMAAALAERGHEITVVCAPPYYPQWALHEGYSNRSYRREEVSPGLTVIRCPVWLPRRLGGLARLLHLASFAMTSFPVMLGLILWRPDVVFVVAPALFSAPSGWLAARLSGAKVWLHVQDLEMDAAFELGLLKGKVLRGAMKAAERRLMRGFDVVSTISKRMLRQLASKGVPMDRSELLPNWVDLRVVHPTDQSQALREHLAIGPDQFVCLFSGTINRKQGLGVLIDAARMLADDPRILVIICGHGELRPGLEAAASDLPNVQFMDLRPASELNALLNMADIHLLPQLRGAADLVMPSKLTGMLASGRPIIAAAIPGTEIASVLEGKGIVAEPECAQAFASAILELVTDTSRRLAYGEAARAYAERVLDSQILFDRLDARLRAVTRDPTVSPSASLRDASLGRRAASDV